MSNETPEFVDIQITSEYGYNFEEVQERLINNVVHMKAMFQTADFMRDELELIGNEFVNTARRIAEQQGLGQGGSSSLLYKGRAVSLVTYGPKHVTTKSSSGNTGNLINHINYKISSNNNIYFYNDAQNPRGQYYAGHIEYGFHDRGGNMVPARPFMRPALYAVAEASRGHINSALKNFLEQMWAMESLQFGYPVTPKDNYRKFYQNFDNRLSKGYGKYTSSKLPKGRLKELSSKEGRGKFTVDRTKNREKGSYSQKLSERMGSKSGWYKDSKGRESYKKDDTRWIKTPTSNSKSQKQTNTKKSTDKEKKSEKPPLFYNTGGSSINPYRRY